MHIRPMQKGDEEAVLQIMNQAIVSQRNAFTAPMKLDEGTEWFESLWHRSIVLLVLVDSTGQVTGWGNLAPYRPGRAALAHVAEVSFYLHEERTGQGWGHLLLGALESSSSSYGITHLLAILLSDNMNSKRFLIKKGFAVWADFDGLVVFEDHTTGHLYMGKCL